MRERIAEVSLWLALLLVGIMFGAVYQRVSLIPKWGLGASGIGHELPRNDDRALDWPLLDEHHSPGGDRDAHDPDRELAFQGAPALVGFAAALFFAMLIWAAIYFVQKGVIPLMERACKGLSPAEITRLARAWISWDCFRMAGTVAALFALLKAATTPIGPKASAPEPA